MNLFAAALSMLRERCGPTSVKLVLVLLAICLLSTLSLLAESNSSSFMSLTSLTITPASGTVVFTDPWSSQAFAQAQNSFGGFQQGFNFSNMNQIVSTNALVQFATGAALADPTNLVMNTTNASSAVSIPNIPVGFVSASSQGTADIFNSTFMITGGTGAVNVSFNSMFQYAQMVMTDIHGINATSEVVFALTINGTVVLFLDSPLAVGSNATKIIPLMSQGLTNSMMLNYDQDYTIDVEVDAESSGQSMPEPSTISLLIGGPALAFGRRWIMAKRA